MINEESTEEVQEEPETKNPIISQVDSSEKKTVHHADSGPQWLGLQFNARQRAKLAEMIVRDSRDYINEETMDVILRSIEAVSRMGSLTLGTSRPFVSTADESGEETKLPEPTGKFPLEFQNILNEFKDPFSLIRIEKNLINECCV